MPEPSLAAPAAHRSPTRRVRLAYACFYTGLLGALALRCRDRLPQWEDAIMSDLLCRADNPRGYVPAALGTVAAALLLAPLPAHWRGCLAVAHRRLATLGALLYAGGLLATQLLGITTPFQESYVPFHVHLALLAFLGESSGVAILLFLASRELRARRFPWMTLSGLLAIAWGFLGYLAFRPDYFHDAREWLAICEWAIVIVISAGTGFLTRICPEIPASRPRHPARPSVRNLFSLARPRPTPR